MDKEIIKQMRNAIKNNDIEFINKSLNNDSDLINCVTFWGTWLHDAAAYGKNEIVSILLQHGVNINEKGGARKAGALTEAAFNGYKDIVDLLYLNGAKLEVDTFRANPLFAAIYNGHVDVAKDLIDKGIDLNVTYEIGSLKNVDAYEYARQYGQTEIANYLKQKCE